MPLLSPLPLLDMGEGLLAVIHYQQQEPKEPHFGRGHESAGLTNHNTPTIIHHWVASPRTGSSREPVVSARIQHQALHG